MRELPTPVDGDNPILRLLDEWHFPLLETRDEIISRHAISLDPVYQWEVLSLPDIVALPGALRPWSADASGRIPPQFPIGRFSTLVWFEDDAHANIRRVAASLAAVLGPAPIGQQWNTIVAAWSFGPARISLTAWPPELQSRHPAIDAEKREPRLRTACHVHVETGYRLALSEQERDWVVNLRPVEMAGAVGTAGMAKAGATAPYETELEYVRDPAGLVEDRQAMIGLSGHDEALIVVANQLYVIPQGQVHRLEVIRLTPAKGAGGSSLHAICRTRAPATEGLFIHLAQSADPDGMNGLADHLGSRLGCPVVIGEPFPDC